MSNGISEAKSQPTQASQLLKFFFTLGNLKTTKRTGWIENEIEKPESISDHMHRMSIMALMINDSTLDITRCTLIALVHDVAESVVGDIAPSANMSKEEKRLKEETAMRNFVEQMGGSEQIKHIFDLWQEYEDGKTPEALLAKDLDKFEMIVQAYEYEKASGKQLDSFFNSTRGKFRHPQVITWVEELNQQRELSRSS